MPATTAKASRSVDTVMLLRGAEFSAFVSYNDFPVAVNLTQNHTNSVTTGIYVKMKTKVKIRKGQNRGA